MAFYFTLQDFIAAIGANAIGAVIDRLPLYSNTTNQQVGVLSATIVELGPPIAGEYLMGTYTFLDDDNGTSTISSVSTQDGQMGAVTGGTGIYSCATGQDALITSGSTGLTLEGELIVCGTPCAA